MNIKMVCNSCGETVTFFTISMAKKAGWMFRDAEINGGYTPVTLCPRCSSNWQYELVVRELIGKMVTV